MFGIKSDCILYPKAHRVQASDRKHSCANNANAQLLGDVANLKANARNITAILINSGKDTECAQACADRMEKIRIGKSNTMRIA